MPSAIGKIEAPRLLRQIGGCEIHRDAPLGEFEARIPQCCAHTIFRFLHFGLGQTDDGEARQNRSQDDASTVTGGASIPASARLCSTARDTAPLPLPRWRSSRLNARADAEGYRPLASGSAATVVGGYAKKPQTMPAACRPPRSTATREHGYRGFDKAVCRIR